MANVSIVISSGKKAVSWVVNENQSKIYNWIDGDIHHIGMGIVSVLYKVGSHRKGIEMIEKGTSGFYIQKEKNYWNLIGKFVSATRIDNETYQFIINTNIPNTGPLDTDKRRSMVMLGYDKCSGKYTGNWFWGYAMIQPINN
tara:strand:+ start:33 stop:458 length:426 start_codon:yes stop_codon:yes gene_type:complete